MSRVKWAAGALQASLYTGSSDSWGTCGMQRRRDIRMSLEAAERTSHCLWVKRGDVWCNSLPDSPGSRLHLIVKECALTWQRDGIDYRLVPDQS